MQDWSKPVECRDCGKPIVEVPTRSGIEQIEKADGTWHKCPRSNGMLNEIWGWPVTALRDGYTNSNLPEPHRLSVIVCVKRIAGDDPLHLIALKDLCGEKVCAFVVGGGKLAIGELSVLCGLGDERELLPRSRNLFRWDGLGRPENLTLPYRWLETAC